MLLLTVLLAIVTVWGCIMAGMWLATTHDRDDARESARLEAERAARHAERADHFERALGQATLQAKDRLRPIANALTEDISMTYDDGWAAPEEVIAVGHRGPLVTNQQVAAQIRRLRREALDLQLQVQAAKLTTQAIEQAVGAGWGPTSLPERVGRLVAQVGRLRRENVDLQLQLHTATAESGDAASEVPEPPGAETRQVH